MSVLFKIKKTFLKHPSTLIGALIFMGLFIMAGTVWFAYDVSYSEAVDITAGAGKPPHNHIGWSAPGGGPLYGNCGSCIKSGHYITHIQKELNYLDGRLPGFDIAQLPVGGSFGSDDNQAVRDYQSVRDILVDGIVGNQTWAQMESDVFKAQDSYRLQAGLQLRFSMWNECRGYTNSAGGPDTFVPIESSGEWNSWKANFPSNISSFAADCSISGGGGGGGGGTGYDYACFIGIPPIFKTQRFCTTLPPPPSLGCVYMGRC